MSVRPKRNPVKPVPLATRMERRIAYDAALACWTSLTQRILDAAHAD